MRIPSTSDLCHSQCNEAYDKLAVISDNIEELKALYDFIFDVQEHIRQLLKGVVHKFGDERIDGNKTFLKPIKVNEINLYNVLDELDNIVDITTGHEGNNPYFLITLKRRDMEEQEDIVGSIKLKLDLSTNTPVFETIDTVETNEQSVVVVKYLNQVVSNLNDLISALDVRVTSLENALSALATRISGLEVRLNALERVDLLDTVQEGKPDAVKSSGIYAFVKAIEQELRSLIGTVDGKVYPIGSKTQKGILQVGEGIDVDRGTISVDLATLATLVGGGEETVIGDDTWRVWRSGKLALVRVPDISSLLPSEERNFTSPVEFVERIAIFQSSKSTSYVAIGDNGNVNVNVRVNGTNITVSQSLGHPAGVAGINILGWIK